ncbi:hypothetical protein OROMI_022554 [Orobanche minor]
MERIVSGKFKLGLKVGSGSFGEIFLATPVDTFQIVAVKIVSCFAWSACSSSVNFRGMPKIGNDEDSVIEGILSGLEKQRNNDFGFNLGKYEFYVHPGN